jgi:hypothetical protein
MATRWSPTSRSGANFRCSLTITGERARRPIVEKLRAAANASSYWYERLPEKMALEPWKLAYDYMTRSGRMTDERLRKLSPKFMARVEAERIRLSSFCRAGIALVQRPNTAEFFRCPHRGQR